jgi:hypothetical protein
MRAQNILEHRFQGKVVFIGASDIVVNALRKSEPGKERKVLADVSLDTQVYYTYKPGNTSRHCSRDK